MTAAQLIREKREEHGMSMLDLAKEVGVSQSTISYWEAGKRSPAADVIPRVARAIGVTEHKLADAIEEGRPAVQDALGPAKKYPQDTAYIAEYNRTHYTRPSFTVRKEVGKRISAAAKRAGQSVSAYILQAVVARMDGDEAEKKADHE